METTYVITINMKVPQGMLELGQFYMGKDKAQAVETFERLSGEHQSEKPGVLKVELVEKQQGVDLVLDRLSCTLEQFTENCRIIAVDAFKYFSLEG